MCPNFPPLISLPQEEFCYTIERTPARKTPRERTHVGDEKRPSVHVARLLRAVCRRHSIALVTYPVHVAAPATRTAATIALRTAVVADSATFAAAALAAAAVAHRTTGVADAAANPAAHATAAAAAAAAAAASHRPAVVADAATLATAAVVADATTLAAAAVVADATTLAAAAVVADAATRAAAAAAQAQAYLRDAD
eukprot:scaffold53696_cov60-Phaeocystis_antarctica.AAC.2